MKKIILGFLFIIVLAISVGVYYVLSNLDTLVKAAIEKYASEATHTAVRVDKVKINLSDGAGSITGLTIANPKGYSMPLAFSLGVVRVGIDLQSLRKEPYIINEVTVLAPQVYVEVNENNKTNLNELKKNLASAAPDAKAEKKTSTDGAIASEPRIIIRRVTFADGNIQARVAVLDDKEYKLKLPGINMTDLGGKNGATPSELAREIIKRLTDRANKRIKEKIIDEKLGELRAKARAKIEAEKAKAKIKIKDEKTRLKQKAGSKLDQQKDKAKEKLKSLFGK